MNQEQFLEEIRRRLRGLPEQDVENTLAYYREMIQDRMEDGLSEEEAVAALGRPEDIAAQILMETPLPTLVKARGRRARTLRAWEIVLLVLGFPLWGSLILTALCVLLAVYVAVWAVIAALLAVAVSLGLCLLAGAAGLVLLCIRGWVLPGILCGSAGLICAGCAILLFFAGKAAARGAVWLGRRPGRWLRTLFVRGGNAV